MSDKSRPDPIERLRYAVWGNVDEPTSEVERRLAEAGDGDELAADVRELRFLRDAVRMAAEAEPPPELVAAVRATLGGGSPAPEPEFPVFRAQPVWAAAGIRAGPGDDINLVCAFQDYKLSAVLHGTPKTDRYALSGQLVMTETGPVAGLEVRLVVDRDEIETTTTDSFGEFEFGEHGGDTFEILVGPGPDAAYVELKGGEGW